MNRVKEFRKEKKMSQLELAKSIGVSRQTINMIENNKNSSLQQISYLKKGHKHEKRNILRQDD